MAHPLTHELSLFERFGFRLYKHRYLALALLLSLPLLWLVVVYLSSLLVFLFHAIFRIDPFSAVLIYEPSLDTLTQLLTVPTNLDIILRTVVMALLVTFSCAVLAYPLAYFMVFYASPMMKAALYISVLLPMWSSYLVKVYAWRQLLAKEGILTWFLDRLGMLPLLDAWLQWPLVGGATLSTSSTGMFLVFTYMWLPFMILPVQAALERVPKSLIDASEDLGATPAKTFRKVTLPMSLPGLLAGSIFTFSLTLGDYIIPTVVGAPGLFIGPMVYQQQGTVGDLPLAAAFSLVPILIMLVYLQLAKRFGAFDSL